MAFIPMPTQPIPAISYRIRSQGICIPCSEPYIRIQIFFLNNFFSMWLFDFSSWLHCETETLNGLCIWLRLTFCVIRYLCQTRAGHENRKLNESGILNVKLKRGEKYFGQQRNEIFSWCSLFWPQDIRGFQGLCCKAAHLKDTPKIYG